MGENIPGDTEGVIGYEKELEEIKGAISSYGSGAPSHVAIISEPLAGRTTIVEELKRLYKDRVHYLALDFVITKATMPDLSSVPADIVLIDNCQFLATRKIGGFDVLEEFLRTQIASRKLFVTTWNVHSWRYLCSVMNIDAYFPTIVLLKKVDTPVLKKIILSRQRSREITIVDEGTPERSMFFSIVHPTVKLPFLNQEVAIPWIKLNFTVMRSEFWRKKRVQIAFEDVIFEKINRIADGNPGVALLVWEKSIKDNRIALSFIQDTTCPVSFDINESFILAIILSMESLHHKDVAAIANAEMDIDRVLYRLILQGFVADTDGYYSITPLALKCVVDYLERTRRL
jgi:hypothetical protein